MDEVINKVVRVLGKNGGLTITELVKVSNSSRHRILMALARLEGANKVVIREAGMAKIYSLKNKSGKIR